MSRLTGAALINDTALKKVAFIEALSAVENPPTREQAKRAAEASEAYAKSLTALARDVRDYARMARNTAATA